MDFARSGESVTPPVPLIGTPAHPDHHLDHDDHHFDRDDHQPAQLDQHPDHDDEHLDHREKLDSIIPQSRSGDKSISK